MLNAFCLHISKRDIVPVRARFSTIGEDGHVRSADGRWKMVGQLRGTSGERSAFAVDGADWGVFMPLPKSADARSTLDRFRAEGIHLFRRLPDSCASVIVCESVLYLFAPKTPGASIFYQSLADGSWVVSTELKALRAINPSLDMVEVEEATMYWEPWRTPIRDAYQVPAGHLVRIDLGQGGAAQLIPYWSPWGVPSEDDHEAIASGILERLEGALSDVSGDSVTSLVSGGLDSSLVTALAKRSGKTVHTFSIGTPHNNEFDYAARFAKSIDSIHQEIVVTSDELVMNYAEMVWLSEHAFSTYLEYLLPGHVAMKRIDHCGRSVISGYGADVLFGGFARPHITPLEVDSLVATEYQSSLWAHETSQTLGGFFGVPVHYPYFESSVVQHSMSIPTHLKHKDSWEKWILRKAADTVIDEEFAWRRKLGIHQSTGTKDILDPICAPLLPASREEARKKKDLLGYAILRLVLLEGCTPDEVQLTELIKEL